MELNSIEILIRLFFAHIVADFLLQPKSMVDRKKEKKKQIHLLHSLLQGIVTYIAVWNWSVWYIVPIVFMSHFIIDYWKITRKERLCPFIIDQCLHLFILFFLWAVVTNQFNDVIQLVGIWLANKYFWIILTGYLLILKPTSVFLYLFTKRWKKGGSEFNSLQDAGKWIGYLERFLILTFILIGAMEGIGFLLAAKSIFRFGDLNKAQELRNTEYILIGTLTSFAIAISIGLIISKGLLC